MLPNDVVIGQQRDGNWATLTMQKLFIHIYHRYRYIYN
jgi:hypothetical protein